MLSLIAVHHKKYVSMVRVLGEYNYCEDIVQEMYLKIHNNDYYGRIIQDGIVNHSYIFFIIKTILYDFYKASNKIIKTQIHDNIEGNDFDSEKENAYLRICQKIDNELKTWHWYDARVFEIYRMHWANVSELNEYLDEFKGNVSIRKMAKQTGISGTSLFHNLKISKKKIEQKFKRDWQNYKIENYHLI